MTKIFISYRQADDPDFAYRIRDWLIQRYGRDNVFMDFDHLPPFVVFEDVIRERIADSDVMLVIIGHDWLRLLKEKEADADDIDYVKLEIEVGLTKKDLIIAPVCIKGAAMPKPGELPVTLRSLSRINAARLESGKAFYNGIEEMMIALEAAIKRQNPDYIGVPMVSASEELQTAGSYISRAAERRRKKDYEGAIADLNEAMRLSPNSSDAYFGRGLVHYLKNEVDRALTDFNETLRLNPNHADAYFSRAVIRATQGDVDGAIADYTESLRSRTSYAPAYKNRGQLYAQKGDYELAFMDFRTYIEIGGKDREVVESWLRETEEKRKGKT